MAQTPHRKFDFGADFSGGDIAAPAPNAYKRLYTAEEVERLQVQARAEGEAAALARAESQTAQALSQMAEAARAAIPTLVEVAHEHRVGSTGLALAAARKIADAACDRFPEAPLQAAMAALAREVEATPRLVLHAAPELIERLQAALEETAQAVGYPGQIVARAEPDLPRAAFILDWGDGRAAFDPDSAAARVGAALEAALAAEGLHGEPLKTSNPESDHG